MLETHLKMDEIVECNNAQKIRVIIVEKHAAVRRALRERLGAAPHLDVIAAVDEPWEALPYLSAASSNVVLLGLQNGSDEILFKTMGYVRQMVGSSAAVIALAPFADEVERLLLQQAGVKTYLLKYIDSAMLIQEIEAAAYHDHGSISIQAAS